MSVMRWLSAVLVVVVFEASAQTVDDGLEAFQRRDYDGARAAWLPHAEQGDATARFYLGVLHEHGYGVPLDPALAVSWYARSAEQGNPHAQYNLGLMYYAGRGVTADAAVAAEWFRRAAAQGEADAQFNLGILHARGEGVPADPVEAYKWLNLAAAQGKVGAGDARDTVRGELTEEQLEEARKRSREWKPRAE